MRFALNPLQWGALPDGELDMELLEPWPALMRQLVSLGIPAMHTLAENPDQLDDYRAALASAGIAAAPGYYCFPAADAEGEELALHLKRADDTARVHAGLGLAHIFVADGLNPVRKADPARGAEPDPKRLARIRDSFQRVAEVFRAHDVLSCLHQHTASWIETEDEFFSVLDKTDPGLLAAGPDTGHLALCGADPVAVLTALGDRVRVAHLKDIHRDKLPAPAGLSYHELVATGVYTEPGRGDLDLDNCLMVLRDAGTEWAVVEVDRPDGLAPADSARRCAEWISARTPNDPE
jgi:inosose dehydratase